MKKIISILALGTLSATSLFAVNNREIDLQAEFKAEQEVALVNFVRSWIKPDSDKDVLINFTRLATADTRYRQFVGDTGLVTKLFSMSGANNKNLNSKDRLNLFMMGYYKETEKLNVDTRSVFSKKPYKVNL